MSAVPGWCASFDAEQYARFADAVDVALSMFGADGQDIDDGYVEMVTGGNAWCPSSAEGSFLLELLAARCQAADPGEWQDLCDERVSDWAWNIPQREWLEHASYREVKDRLDVWMSHQPQITDDDPPDEPDQPFSVRIADGLYVSLLVEVPAVDDCDYDTPTLVTNAAMANWDVDAEGLLDAARSRLRTLPPPVWHHHTVDVLDDDGNVRATVDLHAGITEPDVEAPAAAWALILDEVAPVPVRPRATVAIPCTELLIISGPIDVDPVVGRAQIQAVRDFADQVYRTTTDEFRLFPKTYVYWPPRTFRSGRELLARRTNSA